MGPTIVLLVALLLGIAAGIVYLFQHPEFLGSLQSRIVAAKNATPASVSRTRVGYRTGDVSFTERMDNLDPDTILTVRDPQTAREVRLQVVTSEMLFGCRQYRGSSEWTRSGDNWHAVLCMTDPSFSRTKVLLLQTDVAGYLFRKRTPMNPEGAAKFQAQAEKFARANQDPGSVALSYGGNSYDIQDIGVWDVEGKSEDPHIPPGTLVRWILGHSSDDMAILVEDARGNHDSIWTGNVVDLDTIVSDVLTSGG